jgi:hypothetical protein
MDSKTSVFSDAPPNTGRIYRLPASQGAYGAAEGCVAMSLMFGLAMIDQKQNFDTLNHHDVMQYGAILHRQWQTEASIKGNMKFATVMEAMRACPQNAITKNVRIEKEYTGTVDGLQQKDFLQQPLFELLERMYSWTRPACAVLTINCNSMCICVDEIGDWWFVDTHNRCASTGLPCSDATATGVMLRFYETGVPHHRLIQHIRNLLFALDLETTTAQYELAVLQQIICVEEDADFF